MKVFKFDKGDDYLLILSGHCFLMTGDHYREFRGMLDALKEPVRE